jgi:hypothetical protein
MYHCHIPGQDGIPSGQVENLSYNNELLGKGNAIRGCAAVNVESDR